MINVLDLETQTKVIFQITINKPSENLDYGNNDKYELTLLPMGQDLYTLSYQIPIIENQNITLSMKKNKSFKQWVFPNLFPAYYKDYDTYKDKNGKGILERFIEVCSNYLDTDIIPDIDNFMDILDVDVTPDIFLNYFWEYFDFIPYAYGVLVKGTPFTKENVASWLNTPDGFPKADTRSILKYAVSLYKIRCTQDFYTILGRFYGVRFELEEILFEDGYSNKPNNNPGINYRLIGAVFEDVVSTNSGENE